MIQILLPATGYFAAWMHDDAEGAKALTYSMLSTQAIVLGTKTMIGRKRPNESDWYSFPSGHTSAAFSGAAFLQTRYGAKWGIPAYTAATFVGASRIHGNRHYAGDVIAGAGIAFLMNQYFVSPYRTDGVYFNAQPMQDGLALGVTVTNDVFDPHNRSDNSETSSASPLKHRLELGIGTNFTDSSDSSGATKYVQDSEVIDKFQPFAYINYSYQLPNSNSMELEFSPNETRRRGIVNEDFTLNNETFNKNEQVFTAFRHWMLGSHIYKGIEVSNDFNLDIGLGLYLHMYGLDVALDKDKGKSASEEHWRAMPSISAKGQYFITNQLSAIGKTQYQNWEGDSFFYAEAGLNYQLNPAWDIGLKYGYSETGLDNSVFTTQYDAKTLMLTFANRF